MHMSSCCANAYTFLAISFKQFNILLYYIISIPYNRTDLPISHLFNALALEKAYKSVTFLIMRLYLIIII